MVRRRTRKGLRWNPLPNAKRRTKSSVADQVLLKRALSSVSGDKLGRRDTPLATGPSPWFGFYLEVSQLAEAARARRLATATPRDNEKTTETI